MNGRGGWVTWQSTMPRFAVPMGTPFQAIFVPTVDTVRNSWIIDQLMHNHKHVLCVGDTGTGKSVSLLAKLTKELDKDKYLPVLLSFSAQTTANQTQVCVCSRCACACVSTTDFPRARFSLQLVTRVFTLLACRTLLTVV